jgi:acetyltransferase-like isoleucine patch superfamily enzyme
MAARLRRRGIDFHLVVARGVRFATLPRLRIVDRGAGGSIRMTVAEGVHLGRDLLLDFGTGSPIELRLGAHTEIEHAVRLQAIGGTIVVGESNELTDGVNLKSSVPGARLEVGDRVRLMRRVTVQCHESVTIGSLSAIGERSTIVDSFHDVDGSDQWTMEQPVQAEPVEIGRNCLLSTAVLVTHGATIGRNSVVGASSIVRAGDYPAGSVLVGAPARVLRMLPNAPAHDAAIDA